MGIYFRRTLVYAGLPTLALFCLTQSSVAQRSSSGRSSSERSSSERSNPQHSSPERAAAESPRPDTHAVSQQRRTETRTTRQRTQAASAPMHDAEQRLARLEGKLDMLLREIRQLRLDIRRTGPNTQSRSQRVRSSTSPSPGECTSAVSSRKSDVFGAPCGRAASTILRLSSVIEISFERFAAQRR